MRTREKRERPLTALKKMQFFHSILSEPCVVYGTAFLSNTIYQVRGGESIEIKKSEEENISLPRIFRFIPQSAGVVPSISRCPCADTPFVLEDKIVKRSGIFRTAVLYFQHNF